MKQLFPFLLLLALIASCGRSEKEPEQNKILSSLSSEDSLYATVHLIDTRQPNFLKGKNGACVYIPANAIHNPTQEKVALILKEYLSTAAILDAGLSTSSNGQLLETGGMIHIRAEVNGQELSLASNAGITVLFPKKQRYIDKNFRLFYGEEHKQTGINWIAAPEGTYKKDSARIMSDPGMFTYEISGCPEITIWTPGEDGMRYYNTPPWHELVLQGGGKARMVFDDRVDSAFTKDEIIYLNNHFGSYLNGIAFDLSHDGRMSNFRLYTDFEKRAAEDTMKTIIDKLRSVIQKMPLIDLSPYKLTKQQTVVGNYTIAGSKTLNRERYLKEMYFKNADDIDVNITDYYLFSAMKLGWLNCDRFYTNTSPKMSFTVNLDTPDSVRVFMVFSSFNGVLEGQKDGHTYTFKNLPSDQEVRIVALSHANKKRRMALIRTAVSKTQATLSDFKPFTPAELEEALK